ncbi:LysM peptidoglycan-binding domain-containing protein [Alteromonadaceae bacterium BrNp21-10]|nr:LysM peptidoglycan-binding domain-containing protein [Alteromonadaceae bacterium BrNp21-10]
MYKHVIVILGILVSGCMSTMDNADVVDQQQQEEQDIATLVTEQCATEPHNEEPHCEQLQSGIIPVNHPVEEVEFVVDPEAADIEPIIAVAPEEPKITNLWQRVRNQLNMHVPDNRRVTNQKNWYLKHPHYMLRVTKRATPYLFHIIEEIEQRGMPLELVLLPIVESAFDPFAYSHGRAAGMWQFIPATGKRFGLKQSWWYDGRRDVTAATIGAMDFLSYLHDRFDGNWLHALAAYNSGEGRVRRAINANKKKGKATDFWSLDLPKETRAYVPKLLALADILRNHPEFDDNWYAMDNKPVTQLVDTGSQIDLALAAELADMTVEELHALNAGYNRWATDPDGPHQLLLPIDKVDNFIIALAEVDQKKRLNWVRHKVRSGDSLIKMAKKYHTTVEVIRDVNDIKGNMIVAGDHLLVPVALKSLDFYSLSEDQRLEATQTTKRGSYSFKHIVKSGDNFWDLSRKYKVNLRSLAKWNGMAPTDPLHLGQELVVWMDKASTQQTDSSVMRTLTYTVRNGDSLARIADKFKVLIADIQRWNHLNIKKYLQPGQKLKIFVDVTRT